MLFFGMEILTSTIELIAAIQLLAGLARHCSLGIAFERLAKFVGELWAQRRHVVETRRRIEKRFADENDWFVRKDTELVD